jgi:hypothetical protein
MLSGLGVEGLDAGKRNIKRSFGCFDQTVKQSLHEYRFIARQQEIDGQSS